MDFDMNEYVELLSEVDDLVKITNERVMNSLGIILDNIGYFVQEDTKTLAAVMFWTFLEYDRYYHFDVVLEGLRRFKKHINFEDVARIYFYTREILDFIREFSINLDSSDRYTPILSPEEISSRHNKRKSKLDHYYR